MIRPGARYECHGDGTCCTTIHLLGPMTRAEAQKVRGAAAVVFPLRTEPAVKFHEGIKGLVFAPGGQKCLFLDDNARCRLHAQLGPGQKPAVCRHFPMGSTATDAGVRVTLSHRCPCVSIGASPLLDEPRARRVLAAPDSGRVLPANRAEGAVPWRGKRHVSLSDYAVWEKTALEALDREDGDPIESILMVSKADKLPKLKGTTWVEVAKRLAKYTRDEDQDDGFFNTIRWVEQALRSGKTSHTPPRPWKWTFDRTAERVPHPVSVRKLYGSWIADDLWSMSWAVDSTLYRHLADAAARLVLARRIAARLESVGARADLAAAEAVMIVDVLGASDPWIWVARRLEEAPLATF